MSGEYKPTIAVDFDGVIHQYVSKWTQPEEIKDGPCEGAIEWLRAMLAEFRVLIYSSRACTHEGKKAIGAWLLANGLTSDELDRIGMLEKPTALIYLDDRAVQFAGSFPSADSIRTFKPWKTPPVPIARVAEASKKQLILPTVVLEPIEPIPPTSKNT